MKRKWKREHDIAEIERDRIEKMRLEKLHLKQQRDREILEKRMRERLKVQEDTKKTLELYLNHKESVKGEYIKTIQKQKDVQRTKLQSLDSEKRNKVLQNKQALIKEREISSQTEHLEHEKKLERSRQLHEDQFQERVLLYKRFCFINYLLLMRALMKFYHSRNVENYEKRRDGAKQSKNEKGL